MTVADINDILKRAKQRETTVQIYLAGDVLATIERLERQLSDANADAWKSSSLADTDPTEKLARQIAAARKKLQDSAVEFRFRAMPAKAWSDLVAQHPPVKADDLFNAETFAPALISVACIDPVMTVEQVTELFDVINQAQRNTLFDAAFQANTEGTDVPFSVSASGILSALGAGS